MKTAWDFAYFHYHDYHNSKKRKGQWPLLRSILYELIFLDFRRHIKRDDYCMDGDRRRTQEVKTVCQERFLPERRTPPQVRATFVLKTHHKDVYNHQRWPMYNHTGQTYHPNLKREKKLQEISSEVYRCGGKTTKDQSYCPFGSTTFLTPTFLLSQSVLHFLSSDL